MTRFRTHWPRFGRWARRPGLYDTYIRTDCQLITKKKLTGNAKNPRFL